MGGHEQQQQQPWQRVAPTNGGTQANCDLDGDPFQAVRYEETISNKAPITVAIIPPRSPPTPQSRSRRHTLYRTKTSPSPSSTSPPPNPSHGLKPRSSFWNDHRRDSGRAPTISTGGSSTVVTDDEHTAATTPQSASPSKAQSTSPSKPFSPPKSAGHDGLSAKSSAVARLRKVKSMKAIKQSQPSDGATARQMPAGQKVRISMDIPSGDLFGVTSFDQMAFSNRGSLLLGGKRAKNGESGHARPVPTRRQHPLQSQSRAAMTTAEPSLTRVLSKPGSINGRLLSTDEETLSRRVRSLYDGDSSERAAIPPLPAAISGSNGDQRAATCIRQESQQGMTLAASDQQPSINGAYIEQLRDPYDAAGDDEELEEIDWANVDRYGFIVQPSRAVPRDSKSVPTSESPDASRPHRVSTILQLSSDAPKRRRTLRRGDSKSRPSTRSGADPNASSASVTRPESIKSQREGLPRRKSQHPLRTAVNRFPGNKDRRCLDEAGDMLTLPPGLADIAENAPQGGKSTQEMKEKEWERAEKWRKMAKKVDRGDGQGMSFRFDASDPKLVSRTWKGIPDCWRATAWHSFLLSSAQKRADSPTDTEIVESFRTYITLSSPDDVQIDLDVPRTINSHIMFRQRYRSGQRLLFRVLHSLSLYFPTTGYVQGMASLAATLLCYYDEESCFIMMVRLFQLRNLERLYQPGFAGLVAALSEFEAHWLKGRDVAKKLADLGMDGMVFGTRWYLTMFNYSIPFAAMLRVWDVFMLLGDPAESPTAAIQAPGAEGPEPGEGGFGGGMDVLHATSAALIDGMRDIVLEEDFEGVMKCLTGWIPVRDEEVLMRVVRVEWRKHRARK